MTSTSGDDATITALERLGPRGALPGPVRSLVERVSGFSQVLTTAAVTDAFLHDGGVQVPYGERGARLGLGAFPLALDGAEHEKARALVEEVINGTKSAHKIGLKATEGVVANRLGASTGRLEVLGGMVEPALEAWVDCWFGLFGHGALLLDTARIILHATFLNPKQPKGAPDAVALDAAIARVSEARVVLAAAIANMEEPKAPTVAWLLKDRFTSADRTAEEAAELAADQLLGFTVGPLALGTWAIANTIDELLDHPADLVLIDTRARAASAFVDALRTRAPLPGVIRINPCPTTVACDRFDPDGPRGPKVEVPAGQVLALTRFHRAQSASAQSAELAFGAGAHACLGPTQITEVAATILLPFAARAPHRVPGGRGRLQPAPVPSGFAEWGPPGRLEVNLLAPPPVS